VISVLFLCAVGAVTWYLVNLGQQRLIEIKALDVAEVVARVATSSRFVYAERVVNKLQRDRIGYASETYMHEPGNVPLPAQFSSSWASTQARTIGGLYHYSPLSKWNLARNQGLADSFQRWRGSSSKSQDRFEPEGPNDCSRLAHRDSQRSQHAALYARRSRRERHCVECHTGSSNVRKP